MSTRERAIVLGLLGVLLTMNFLLLIDRVGASAHAAATNVMLETLGPADAIILSGTGGNKDVSMRNAGGRLAWSDTPHDRVYSLGYVAIGDVMRQLMDSEQFNEEREILTAELTETEMTYRDAIDAIRARLQQLPPDSEEARKTYEEGAAKFEEYQGWQQQAVARRGKLDAQQLERAYRDLVAAVDVVAEKQNIDIVYRFIPTEEPFNTENPDQALQSIRLRTALRYPDSLDITDAVLEEMSLELE